MTIPNSVTSIGNATFEYCSSLTSVTVDWNTPLAIGSNVFTNSSNATLYVPSGTKNAYLAADNWKDFKEIVEVEGDEPDEKKCATPTISYADGKLTFDCATDGVEYVYDVTLSNTLGGSNTEVTLSDKTLLVTVYATKEGYENSETATKEIKIGAQGDLTGDGEITVADVTRLIDIVLGKEQQ